MVSKFEKSRAAYYKQLNKLFLKEIVEDTIVREQTLLKRKQMPGLGGKKLYHLLKPILAQNGLKINRDKYFMWLKENGLLVKVKKSFTKTTNSWHHFNRHTNLLKYTLVNKKNQVFVSDITYIRLQKGFCYLALTTDAYSRKIVGYDVSNTLELSGCLRALKMASKGQDLTNTIHHSDHGIQYCSHEFTKALRKRGMRISMGEIGNCYENAMAERINGILKNEFNLDATFKNIEYAKKIIQQAIDIYNNQRPHLALKMKKPSELYAA